MSGLLLVEQVLNGLQFGLMLFLLAAGLTLVFGVMDMINLAHGSLYMVGAFVGAWVAGLSGSFALGLVAAVLATAAFGMALEASLLRPLYARDHLSQVLATFALILILNDGVRMTFGTDLPLAAPAALDGPVELLPGLQYPAYRLLILGAGLCAVAGVLMGPLLAVQVGMGENILILAFVVIVVGGIGSIRGALVGALLVGAIDTLGRTLLLQLFREFLPPQWASAAGPAVASVLIYVFMAAVLAIKPQGLFPARG